MQKKRQNASLSQILSFKDLVYAIKMNNNRRAAKSLQKNNKIHKGSN